MELASTTHIKQNIFLRLLPMTCAVFVSFLTIGLALPILPLHIHDTLNFNTFVIGIIVGCQFAVALLSRAWAGRHTDTRGAKHAVVTALILSSLSGGIYLFSLGFLEYPIVSVGILLFGRILLGYGESLVSTGAFSWGVTLVGPQNAGKVMAWVGIAIYAAYAIGAPIGMTLYAQNGFEALSLATLFIPLIGLVIILPVTYVVPQVVRRVPFYKVIRAVYLPGLGLSFASVGFVTLTAFIALQFSQSGWGDSSLAFTSFGIAFILARLFFAGLPDRIGGAKVAFFCVLIEALGQFIIWYASNEAVTYLGVALTGFGYSLAFPGFGVEAVRRAPAESRGAAMGAYGAFMDLAFGIAGPTLGFIANSQGVNTVYLVSTGVVLGSVIIAILLITNPHRQDS